MPPRGLPKKLTRLRRYAAKTRGNPCRPTRACSKEGESAVKWEFNFNFNPRSQGGDTTGAESVITNVAKGNRKKYKVPGARTPVIPEVNGHPVGWKQTLARKEGVVVPEVKGHAAGLEADA
ncbi:hypothetical protein NDU88_001206 [Pleurodeles waltl]|uniref:Uncharacterized protein n=1 Tax=Pleurodeles waltl TaxID=8319 RepID=A0AAV7VYR3_PLEWA|nr:hypothetical protein NDU88_001206 [Pleurodeles waltl]